MENPENNNIVENNEVVENIHTEAPTPTSEEAEVDDLSLPRIKPNANEENENNEAEGEEGASEETQERQPQQRRRRNNNRGDSNGGGSSQWHRDLKKCVVANDRIQKNRLNPHYKLNLQSNTRIKITPLGGLGEIGGNITVFETQKSAIVVDVGMSFPSDDMHGVDILVPDFSYLREIKHKIAGIIITHAHEDHIGAVPYLFKEMQFPLYGTPLPLGMIGAKFDEQGLAAHKKLFRAIEKRKPLQIGEFEIEWIHITHSIIDASALAIKTDAGTIVHTGDFKIDNTPIDNFPTDLQRLAYYGEKGVMLLMSDSTNSNKEGFTKSESAVGPTFDHLFATAKGRVIMSTFSSNIHRVYQAIQHGMKYKRKVSIIGRSMEKNLNMAMELGYISLPKNIFIDAHEVGKYSDNEVLIVTTGSQGETMSALYRMAIDEHRHIKIKPTDTIIISAKAIPGNEKSVSTVINLLQKADATVAYQDFSEIHVSGHAAQEEQKLMLQLIKPKYFLPVHGEYNHLTKHKETAIKCGIPEKNIYLMSDGDQVEVGTTVLRKVKNIKTGKVYVDNQINDIIENDVVIDRQKLATDGIVMIIAQISKSEEKLIGSPKVMSYGLVPDKEDKAFSKEMEDLINTFLKNCKKEIIQNPKALEYEIRQTARKHILRKKKKYPTIVPTVYIM